LGRLLETENLSEVNDGWGGGKRWIKHDQYDSSDTQDR